MYRNKLGKRCGRACALVAMAALLLAGLWVWAEGAVWPNASGKTTYKKSGAVVDASHAEDGYIMAKYKPSKKKLKARVAQGDTAYQYDQNGRGDYEVYSLQMGAGKYKLQLYEQVKGSRYAPKASVSFSVKEMREHAPFLCPNQYIWYTEDSQAVAKSLELCEGLAGDMDKVSAVYKFIAGNIRYHYVRAMTVEQGYLPDVDLLLSEGQGICFDIAALAAAMLRVQGIPTKLVIGYADRNYHAWNEVYVDGAFKRIDLTGAITGAKPETYTAERYY
ncbi:transglutaminase family protein [Bacillota bacterium Meth-B3]|nr:transglutaminase-like domain-containing protein [Christensenellaceae bacterium]MEA5067205.1 transglutaminase-like domain-containing protein [Eubacteriales bacterium]MEA5067910.1 transglutaminase-like domain-containing protein [Christensenellaceae bacterium]